MEQIVFRQPDGSTATNLVSNGPENTDNDLQLTYFFEWNYPHIEDGTDEHQHAIQTTDLVCIS